MALLHADPFDHYLNATDNYNSATNNPVTVAALGFGGTKALQLGSGQNVIKTLSASYATLIAGCHFKMPAPLITQGDVFLFADAGTTQVFITINSDGTLKATRGTTVLGTSSFALSAGVQHHIVAKVKFDNTTGTVDLYADGANILSLSGLDTQQTANASANSVTLVGAGATGRLFDNFYIDDATVRHAAVFKALFPNADGTYTAYTPSTGVNHYATVDENPPSMTDYNSSAVSGDRDSYTTPAAALPTGATVIALIVAAYLSKDDAGVVQSANFVRVSGTDYDGTTQNIASSAHYYNEIWENNPNTAAAWTEAQVDAAEIGNTRI